MESPEEIPNFRKFDARSAFRTVAYEVLTLACLLTMNVLGDVVLVHVCEGRRNWLRRTLRPVATQLREDYQTLAGLEGTRERLTSSAVGQAMLFEIIALGVS